MRTSVSQNYSLHTTMLHSYEIFRTTVCVLQCYTHTKSSELQSTYYNVTLIRNLQNYSLHTTILHSYDIFRTAVYILQYYTHTKSSELQSTYYNFTLIRNLQNYSLHTTMLRSYEMFRTTVYILQCYAHTKCSELQSTYYTRTLIRNLPNCVLVTHITNSCSSLSNNFSINLCLCRILKAATFYSSLQSLTVYLTVDTVQPPSTKAVQGNSSVLLFLLLL